MTRSAPLLFAAFLLAPAARAEEPEAQAAAVLSSGLEFYRAALEGLKEGLGRPVAFAVLPEQSPPLSPETRVVVAFGAKAASLDYPDEDLLVYAMAPGVRIPLARRRKAVRIAMTPRAEELLRTLRQIQPGMRSLLVFWTSDVYDEYVDELRRKGAALDLKVQAPRVEDPADLPARLRALAGKPDAIWLPPDPLLVNAESFAVLKEYSRSHAVPFYAPSQGFAEKGATAAVSVDFREIGRTAAAVVRQALAGQAGERMVYPQRITVTINLGAAAACGLTVPSETLRKADKVLP